jgi:hypothetical protein
LHTELHIDVVLRLALAWGVREEEGKDIPAAGL